MQFDPINAIQLSQRKGYLGECFHCGAPHVRKPLGPTFLYKLFRVSMSPVSRENPNTFRFSSIREGVTLFGITALPGEVEKFTSGCI